MKILKYIAILLCFASTAIADPRNYIVQPTQNPEFKIEQYKFDGKWMPEYDPSEIGPNNYRTLKNMRYENGHPAGIRGYTKVNTTALTDFDDIRSGFQLRTDRTQPSYFLVWATDGTDGKVYKNTTAIPTQGDFTTTPIHTDVSNSSMGRFSEAPNGSVTYANGKEAYVWSGDEMRVEGFFKISDPDLTNPIEFTNEVNNTLTVSGNTVELTPQNRWVIITERPIQGVNYTVETVNATASTMTGDYWTGSSWAALSLTDDTDTGPSLGQSGKVSFASTVDTAKPYHFEGFYAYAYRFSLDAGTAELSHVSVDAPWQPIIDLWDGVGRTPIEFQIYNGTEYEDYTYHVNTDSDINTPIGGLLDGLTNSAHLIVMFEEQTAAIDFTMLAGLVNENASVLSGYYWDGTNWSPLTINDGTDNSGDTFGESGLVSWNPPSDEHAKTAFNSTGYAYRFRWTNTLSGTKGDTNYEIVVDKCTGVPAQYDLKPVKFTSTFKGRTLRCNFSELKQGNRVDFSVPQSTSKWNGEDSSRNGIQSLYFGSGRDELTTGTQLYNRYGSNVFEIWLAFTKSSMFQLKGSTPTGDGAFEIDTVSDRIGCPAPMTLASVTGGYDVGQGTNRNIVIWLSYAGPYGYDGNAPFPIPGVSNYFDPTNAECIDFTKIDQSCGWYDSTYHEYNLVLPDDVWLVYDLLKKKWYEKSTGSAKTPRSGFAVTDTDGVQYIYAGLDNGYVMRLENGTSWDGIGIEQEVQVGDFWPSGSIWDRTRITGVKVIAERVPGDHTLNVTWYEDSLPDPGIGYAYLDGDFDYLEGDFGKLKATLTTLNLSTSTNAERLSRDTTRNNLSAWTHSFGFNITTDDATKAFQPIGWAIKYQRIGDDL